MKRITNSLKSHQILGHGKKTIDVENVKQLSTDSELTGTIDSQAFDKRSARA